MAVVYKYSNENEVIIENGDDYTIDFSRIDLQNYYQAIGSYIHVQSGQTKLFASRLIKGKQGTISIWSTYSRKPWIIAHPTYGNDTEGKAFIYEIDTDNHQNWLDFYPSFHVPATQGMKIYTGETIINRSVYLRNNLYTPNPKDISYRPYQATSLQILFWHPVTYIPQFELKIFQNGTLIYTRTEEFQPEYVQILKANKKCPSDTCPVKCDEYVCCYNSKGIATESFLFEESIYQ